jgi:hypothetical protein
MTSPKKKSAKSECGLNGEEAQAAYEQTLAAGKSEAPRAKDLADHIADCGACSSALHALELQGDAVSALAKQPEAGTPGTVIESVLRSAAKSGTGKLADLTYELAKACLVRLPDLERRVRRVVEPRKTPVVARELRTLNERRGLAVPRVELDALPSEDPAESDALRAATSCLNILKKMEGNSPRHVLGMSQVHVFAKRPELAESLLRELLEQPLSPQMDAYARINLMLSLTRQAKYDDVVALGQASLRRGIDNWEVLYNLAVAYAYLKNHSAFSAISSDLAKLVSRSQQSSLHDLLEYESPRFAAELSVDPRLIAQRFGILPARRSRRNAS